jgi:outer membrane protein TolC
VRHNETALALATKLYNDGLTDYLNVITAQRSLFSAQDMLVQSRQRITTHLIALYKALGGGWEILDESDASVKK